MTTLRLPWQQYNLLKVPYFQLKAGVHVNLSEILVSLKRG